MTSKYVMIDSEPFFLDSDDEIQSAQEALALYGYREEIIWVGDRAEVQAGECVDAVKTSERLYAAEIYDRE